MTKFSLLLFLKFFGLFFATLHASQIERLSVEILKQYPHDPKNFTQGLELFGNALYESSGLYGLSGLKKSRLETGEVIKEISLPSNYFAEGIAKNGNQLVVLTWKEGKACVYDSETFELMQELSYSGEGWGLCFDGNSYWMSNGTSTIYRRNASTFEIEKTITVKSGQRLFNRINDLICVDDSIYANVWQTDIILQIDKHTGEVTGIVDASSLLSASQKDKLPPGAVLNGLTYRKENRTFLVTGKYWPLLFEVRFFKK